MAYIDYDAYTSLYDVPGVTKKVFDRIAFDACRLMDAHTTGIDGVKKLKAAFPADADDAEVVKRCACKLVSLMCQIEEAEKSVSSGRGYVETENGLQRKIVSRVESGSEAISYSESQGNLSVIDKAVADKAVRDKLFQDAIREYLSGICDANGVNLLYMGVYPCV